MSKGKKQQAIPEDRNKFKPGLWDCLNDTFTALADYALLPTQVAGMLRNDELLSKVSDKQLLAERASTMVRDAKQLAGEMLAIKDEHKSKIGEPKNPDDHAKCLDIHSRYVEWAERYESIVYPNYVAINAQLGQALDIDIMKSKPTDLPTFKPKEASND